MRPLLRNRWRYVCRRVECAHASFQARTDGRVDARRRGCCHQLLRQCPPDHLRLPLWVDRHCPRSALCQLEVAHPLRYLPYPHVADSELNG